MKKHFPPRLWPEAYNDARSSANRSGMDAVQYRKRNSDPFWCAQLKEKAISNRYKQTKRRPNEESDGQNLSNAQIDESDSEPGIVE